MAGCGENDENKVKIEVSGNKPKSGTVTIENGQVTSTSEMDMGDYSVSYDSENEKYIVKEIYKGILCTKKDGVDLPNLTYGNEFTCELGDNDKKTFYVLETNEDNVSLIMNANIDSNGKAITPDNIPDDKGLVAWSSDGSNHKDEDESTQAVTAKAYLSSSTTSWARLNRSQITLPTAPQIATASGKTFDDSGSISGLETWLYDYLNGTANSVSDIIGYWTLTPYIYNSSSVWDIGCDGAIGSNDGSLSSYFGIRPVITIPKSQ